jgi:hypothetical protein
MKVNFIYLQLFFLVFIFASCSHDYKGTIIDEEISEKIPNVVMVNFKEVSVRKGKIAYIVKAKRAEMFDKQNLTSVKDLQFYEYGSDNSLAAEGEVSAADFYTDSENIVFKESFRIYSAAEEYYINGTNISWNNAEKKLVADDEDEVTIGKDSGSFIKGKGFYSYASDKSFGFTKGVEGHYIADDEDSGEREKN